MLYDSISVHSKYVDEVDRALVKALDTHRKSARSLNSRILPRARRLKEMGIKSVNEIHEIDLDDNEESN